HSELLRIQNRFLDEFRPELDRRKAERGVAGYDDLLNRLRAALLDSERGPELTRTLQRRYRAALIDEFQDTDPVQWDIFRTLFAHRSHSLFLIGDPRQSIYRFRGADVQAYLNARNNARRLTTLTVNYRQRSALLQGINIIFNENASGPVFLHEHIQYRELESAGKADPFTPDVLREQAPLVIWHLSEADAEEQQWRTDDLSETFMQSMAREIQLLLRSPSSSDALRARDIAVLVRTNDEGEQVRNTLATWNIPAVLHSDRSVFATPEADDFEKILNAMANPGDPMGVKQALCTPSFGYTVQAIQALNIGQDGSVFLRFQLAHEHWQREGFLSAFQYVLNRENLRERILARPGGERALTNLLHLAEIVHADCHGQGAEQTLRYVARNRQAPGSDESHILRLESDRDAVRIMTIHLSKGLEFPVVFCPFLWRGRNASGPDHLFAYDPETGGTCFVSRTLREYREMLAQANAIESLSTTTEAQDNGGCIRLTADELQRMQRLESRAREAELAEEVRLFYVAATRASQRLYLCWGRTRNTARSAAAWVLHGRRRNASPETKLTLSAEDIQADHADLEARSNGLLRVIHPDDSPGLLNDGLINETHPGEVKSGGPTTRNQSAENQSARNQSANIQPAKSHFVPEQAQHSATIRTAGGPYERRWQIYSYTSLFGTGQRDEHLFHLFDLARDHDGGPGHTSRAYISDATEVDSAEQFDIFTFPAGARAGICLHAIFEELAFDENPEGIANVVTRQLSHYQFDIRFVKAVSDMVRNTLQCKLIEANGNTFCLRDVGPTNRLTELAFYYPINNTDSDASHMRGFIDLVCAHADRYYLLDWKSNHLGNRAADYTTAELTQEMTRSDYHKQYMIYLDALDRYLSYRLTDYDYETHMGGVFYIFLRGVQQGDSTGIYYHRPQKSELEDFRRQLSGYQSESKSFTLS
ncbi:MAG: UvrD-helicase domain-containing protein, partial [Leptospiraceae bacterium]|nr:UvrD-helicase domain-containing protein [Leptospiraceae bacterium]